MDWDLIQPDRSSARLPLDMADVVRATERERLRALVMVELDIAEQLHANDFQLVTPGGGIVSKVDYLSGISSGALNYQVWEPDSPIDVRLYSDVALLRYRSNLQMIYEGQDLGVNKFWHTDSYERRDDRWQIVWSQATRIR